MDESEEWEELAMKKQKGKKKDEVAMVEQPQEEEE